MKALQIRLRERRNALNLTLSQVASALGITEATVQRYESGEIKNIKYNTIIKLAEILHCSPTYLLGWEENNNNIINYNSGAIANGNNSYAILSKNEQLTPQEKELICTYKKLDIKDQTKLLSYAFELESKDCQ